MDWSFLSNYSYLTPALFSLLYSMLFRLFGFGLVKPNKKIEDVELLIIKIRDKYFKLYSDFLKDYYIDYSTKVTSKFDDFINEIEGNTIDKRIDDIVDRNFKTINHYICLKQYIKKIEFYNKAISSIFLFGGFAIIVKPNNYIFLYIVILIIFQTIFIYGLSKIYKEIGSIKNEYKL